MTGGPSDSHAAPAPFFLAALAHENALQRLFVCCVLSNNRCLQPACKWMLVSWNGKKLRDEEREREREHGYVLFLLSDGVGVKRLIILKPVGLPGTFRYFPYNIKELDRDHCKDYLSTEIPPEEWKALSVSKRRLNGRKMKWDFLCVSYRGMNSQQMSENIQ